MPDKHIKLSESYIGLGAFILETLTRPKTIDHIWMSFKKARKADKYPSVHSFESVIIALDMLYAIGAIQEVEDKEGWYKRCAC